MTHSDIFQSSFALWWTWERVWCLGQVIEVISFALILWDAKKASRS